MIIVTSLSTVYFTKWLIFPKLVSLNLFVDLLFSNWQIDVEELVLLYSSLRERDILELGKEIPHLNYLICGIWKVISSVILLWGFMVSGGLVNFSFYSQSWPPQEVLQGMLRHWHNNTTGLIVVNSEVHTLSNPPVFHGSKAIDKAPSQAVEGGSVLFFHRCEINISKPFVFINQSLHLLPQGPNLHQHET